METLEQTVRDLRSQVAALSPSENWLEKITGSISPDEEEDFLEAMELGRQYRIADRPPDEDRGPS